MSAVKFRAAVPLLVLPGLLLAGESDVNSGERNVRVVINGAADEPIRLEARHARLAQVFDAIAGETGVRIHYSSVPDEFVSVKCAGASVKQVVECVLGPDADLIFRNPDGASGNGRKDRRAELWVLESSFGSDRASLNKETSSQCLPPSTQESTKKGGAAKAQTENPQSQPDKTAALLDMAAADDPTQRSQALSQLIAESPADNDEVRKALEKALSDEDPSVRAQAVYGLARREGAGASGILQAALHDSDLSVRLMAVDSAGNDRALLHEALADSDATVRGLAALKLEELSDTENLP
jgi:hypothetical protein